MTGKVVFLIGEPKEIVFDDQVFMDQNRLFDTSGTVLALRDKPGKTKFYREGPHLIIYIRDQGTIEGRKRVLANETVSGDDLNLPYVESITHSTGSKEK